MRIALGVEYDGSAFRGWQTQPGGQTVQDALELALSQIAGEPLNVVCAGRTDAGVHATGQVVHFDTQLQRPLSAWVRGTNSFLPPAVAVRWAKPVPDEFHAAVVAGAAGRDPVHHHAPLRARGLGRGIRHRPLRPVRQGHFRLE